MLRPDEIEAVLDQSCGGHHDAFRLIVRAFGLPLRCYIASQVHHPNDVDDLTQEVFLAAYRRLDSFRRGDDFGAWLRGIARNKLHDYFRYIEGANSLPLRRGATGRPLVPSLRGGDQAIRPRSPVRAAPWPGAQA